MPELAEIFRQAGGAYLRRFAGRVLPSHRKAINDIAACRTPVFGGHVYRCDHPDCGALHFAYHSCCNRHCPKCQHTQTQRWIEKLTQLLLPCPYFLLTFTLPHGLRALARSNQKLLYGILIREAAASLLALAADRQWIGGRPGIVAVLHTWSRSMAYHPHVHLLATAGGLTDDQAAWIRPAHQSFPLPGFALSKIFRAKVRDALRRTCLLDKVDADIFRQKWVVHVRRPEPAPRLVQYLSRYLYRVALTNPRIESFVNASVTFRYVDSRTHHTKRLSLTAEAFIARFLQHVLPKGFPKVRYFGLFSPNSRNLLARARHLLALASTLSQDEASIPPTNHANDDNPSLHATASLCTTRPCPTCHRGTLQLLAVLNVLPTARPPP